MKNIVNKRNQEIILNKNRRGLVVTKMNKLNIIVLLCRTALTKCDINSEAAIILY